MEKKLSKRAIRNLLFIAGTVLIVFLAVLLYDSPGYTTYVFPPDISEWFFEETPEELVEKCAPNARIDDDGNFILIVRNDKRESWLVGADTAGFDAAMQNENIQISSDFTKISVTCNDADTWESDFRTAENATIICILKQLINGVQPENLSVTIDLIDGVIGETVYRIDYPPGMYSFNSHEIFSFME